MNDQLKKTKDIADSSLPDLANQTQSTKDEIVEKFVLAALGSIPWVGGFLSAAASIKTDQDENEYNELQTKWIKEHQDKIRQLALTISDVSERLRDLGDEVIERIQSEEYLELVRQAFRVWDKANAEQKRKYVANIISNSGSTNLCSDDVIRLFITWLDKYDEIHFHIMRVIYKSPGSTRYQIWEEIREQIPRDDSADADLFKLIIRDLTLGGVMRQERRTNAVGQYLKKSRRTKSKKRTMESAFERTKPYELTELGKQFVHYTMNEVVTRIEDENRD